MPLGVVPSGAQKGTKAMKCHIRTKFGSTAAFGRRIEAFYAQIDWNIEMEERGGMRPAAKPRPNPQGGGRAVREAAVIDLLGGKEVR